MYATSEGTSRYVDKRPAFRDNGFYRTIFGLQVSTLGIGTYLGGLDDASDQAYIESLIAAGEGGINFFDSAINYRHQRSERCVGAALSALQRDEIVVCTKAGFLTPGAVPDAFEPGELAGGMHCMAPRFLADQAQRSRDNLGVETIDVFYLHNPETQLGFRTHDDFYDRIRRAFAHLELMVDERIIRWYGAATWDGFRQKGALNLERLAQIAIEEGGMAHHFRFVQLPFNLGMVEAFVDRPESVLETAGKLGMAVVASGTLLQARILEQVPEGLRELMPDLGSDAQRAIQFTRSTPGIAVALVGMGRREHVQENLGIARVRPCSREQYQRLYR